MSTTRRIILLNTEHYSRVAGPVIFSGSGLNVTESESELPKREVEKIKIIPFLK